jgi:hypothetical protein
VPKSKIALPKCATPWLEKSWLARECAKLNPLFEKAMAEEGLSEELSEWPEY